MVSVIVPVYMVEKYLDECIQSILSQTFSDFELILIDDGSRDRCPMICEEYAKKDHRIKVIHQKNQGLSAARNAGLDAARGEYITFIDSDDVVTKNYLKILYTMLIQNGTDISISGYQDFSNKMFYENDLNSAQYVITDKDDICSKLYQNENASKILWVAAWGKLYKSTLFTNIRFPVGKIHEDQFTTYQLFLLSKKNAVTNIATYGYRQRENSIMHSRNLKGAFDEMQGVEQALESYLKRGMNKSKQEAGAFFLYLEAKYNLMASANGEKINIPRRYKMKTYDAIHIIENRLGRDMGEYVAYSIYPKAVKKYNLLSKFHLIH